MFDAHYGGVIWTNHALARLKERGIKQGDAWATWRSPDQSRYAATQGAWVYYKTYPLRFANGASGQQKIEVVARQNEKRQWVILSVWSKTSLGPGETTFQKGRYQEIKPLWRLVFDRIFKKTP